MPQLADETDLPAHELDQAFRNGEPQASPTVKPGRRSVDLPEMLEEVPVLIARDADASVDHSDAQTGVTIAGDGGDL